MDSIGDYIYLIIIIIAALSGILKKKKPVQSPAPDSEPQDFEEILRELIPQEPVIVPQQSFNAQTQKETASIISYENTDDISALKAKKQVSNLNHDMQSAEKIKIAEDENNINNEIHLNSAEEAKRAFIYAEIFNKKY
ncbi:MAG: hypothetical protein LLF95_09420 [Bacteroidales bacterium]|nr:hypothetical protein [Bacteroidales bacterium]